MSFKRNLEEFEETARTITETMINRGPDDGGIWLDKHIFLGHRRLSVIDLEGGHQPMEATNQQGHNAIISYTGEVYNYRELREELIAAGHQFNTQSDTEVVLSAYLEWGEDFAKRLNGIYAFAIWDVQREELLLVRDRMGVKPLYYYPLHDEVLFASEPKAILAHPEAEAVVDAEGLREIFSIVKTPGHAVFRGMYEVKPGTILKFNRKGKTETQYWKLRAREHTDDLETTIDEVRELLTDIVQHQMVADVPLGVLLSGGLDSSAITALAARVVKDQNKKDPLLAFSIDFVGHAERFSSNVQWEDPDTPFAIEVAKHVGAEHINVMLDHNDVMNSDVREKTLHVTCCVPHYANASRWRYPVKVQTNCSAVIPGSMIPRRFNWTRSPGTIHSEKPVASMPFRNWACGILSNSINISSNATMRPWRKCPHWMARVESRHACARLTIST